jgi:hypothetical protein
MKRSSILANRLREVLLQGHWIANTNCKEQIERVTWEEATKKVFDLNTIAMLTFHLNYYLKGLIEAWETGKLTIRDQFSFDLGPIQSQADWDHLVQEFIQHATQFSDLIEHMEDDALDNPFIDEKYGSNARNIEGVIEHSYYHLGQISLIKKMLASV